MNYQAPWWLPGGNPQTIWPALAARCSGRPSPYRRERWLAPDGDFVDLDWLGNVTTPALVTAPGARGTPLLVLFHGLEGSSQSHYAKAFAEFAAHRGLRFVVPHFRGCSGELNHGPRAYHSGDHEEIGWILARLRAQHQGPLLAVGVSLGGNALLRWAAEAGSAAAGLAGAVASVCSPLDLAASAHAIDRGFNRLTYNGMFLRSMKPKAMAKLKQHPGLFDAGKLMAARDLYQFDDVFTAPLHGFRNADDYYARASAKPHLQSIRIPALVLNALNDPFVPAISLPSCGAAGEFLTLWQPREGGHVGFPDGHSPGQMMPREVGEWLLRAVA